MGTALLEKAAALLAVLQKIDLFIFFALQLWLFGFSELRGDVFVSLGAQPLQ